MKLFFIRHALLPLSLMITGQLSAAASTQSSAVVTPLFPNPSKTASPSNILPGDKSLNLTPTEVYASPGTAIFQNSQWVGRDHLYNLTNQIGLVIDITQPDGKQYKIDEAAIRQSIERALAKSNIQVRNPLIGPNSTPLPFLHFIVVMNTQATGLIVAFCGCRLFESVQLERVRLDPGVAWQAITWEDQILSLIPPDQLQATLLKDLTDLADKFAERFNFYKLVKPGQVN